MKTIEKLYVGKNKSSIVNLLRYKYKGDMELSYLKETENPISYCIYCNEKSEFISIFKGYKEICNSHDCSRKYFLDKNKEANLRKTNRNKILVRCNVCERIEIKISNRNLHKSNICDSEYCQRNKNRPFILEKKIIKNFDYKNLSYLNNLIYSLMIEYREVKKVNRILYKNFLVNGIESSSKYLNSPGIKDLLADNFNPGNFEKTRDNLYFINLNRKNKEDILKKIYKNKFDEYNKKYYPEFFSICTICNKEYKRHNIYRINKHKSEKTCSLACYRKNFKSYMTPERKEKQSNSMKDIIQKGLFTPNVFNSNTRKNIELKNGSFIIKFRSSWELLFYIMNDCYEYEKLRIPYIYDKKERIYLVDFINDRDKIAIEIKPKNKKNDIKNKLKNDSLIKWCEINNYEMHTVTEEDLKKYDYELFKEKVKNNQYLIDDKIIERINKLIN